MKLLIANRGEIAIRIARAAAELEIPTVAIYSKDDERSLHVRKADAALALDGVGSRAYLDIEAVLDAAQRGGCDAVHPGYGFLSENADFAKRCEEAGLAFVGPLPDALALFGDKTRARQLAAENDVPVVAGLSHAVDVEAAKRFFDGLPAGSSMLFKAAAGGGGRGMRIVTAAEEIDEAFQRAGSEARAAFGVADVYVERFIANARHVEVQVAADGAGGFVHFGDRDCTIQRRHQKLIEVAPAPALSPAVREGMATAALRLARAANYRSLATFEFLVTGEPDAQTFYFIEANARLQVEHTVTEEVTGVDLVQLQLRLAQGQTLATLGIGNQLPRGHAVQARVNMETMAASGETRPGGGTLTAFDPPTGPGIRTDTFGYAGYVTSPNFDSLLAKVIVRSEASFAAAVRKASRALDDFRIEGVATNIAFLRAIMNRALASPVVHTRFVDDNVAELVADAEAADATPRYFEAGQTAQTPRQAGAKLDSADPLAVLEHGKSTPTSLTPATTEAAAAADGQTAITAPMQGTIVSIEVEAGQDLTADTLVLVMEAMKMEHEIRAPASGTLTQLTVSAGDTVWEGHALGYVEEKEVADDDQGGETAIDLDHVREDLAEVHQRHEATLDSARPDAIEKRRRTEQRTARENVDDLCDPDTFVEHGQLVLTPGTGLSLEETIRKFPTDGMITGIGAINGDLFGPERARCVVMSYDYTVLAGTQGAINHPKTDRMLELAEKWRIPMVLFAEGGGGRAGTGGRRNAAPAVRPATPAKPIERFDAPSRPLDTPTFASMGRLSGLVPMVGITSRYCFAGNASLLGCCDIIIATRNSNIGMGGPALIEGGGLGVFRPEEIGPLDVQTASGVVDVAVEDEAEAVAVAKRYLSYFQGRLTDWNCPDQRHLRNIVPENRLRIYNVREVIETLADTDSVLELRPKFGLGMVTAFIRIEGRAIGVLANNPQHLSGAIDSDGSDKAARFLQLCDAFDIPVLVLCDTPGMMVGPEVEKTALVRHCSRLFVTGANLTVPHVTMVLRKAYGLGAQAMAGGSFKEPFASVAWPTGEFGGMGLEGQVKLGFRNELAAIEDAQERIDRYEELVAAAYQRGKALNAGMSFAVDDVIDPADSRRWITAAFDAVPPPLPRAGKKRRNVDTW